jgi:hypothetical protein
MKKLTFLLLCVLAVQMAVAQNSTSGSVDYKTAIGVKLWNGGGVNLKTFLSEKSALELIGFFYRGGTRITGLYELHGDLNTEGNLKWYVGFGAHVDFVNNTTRNTTGFGVDGVIGLDYKFTNIPFNIAVDWNPSVQLGVAQRNGLNANRGGIAFRFTL